MTNNTLFAGIALLVIGLYAYFVDAPGDMKEKATRETAEARKTDPAAPEVVPGKVSPTALIPAAFGVVMLGFVGLVIYKYSLLKHVMHAAAAVGLIGFLGGFYYPVKHATLDWQQAGVRAGILMSLVCGAYVAMAVKSFIDARKAREAGQPAG